MKSCVRNLGFGVLALVLIGMPAGRGATEREDAGPRPIAIREEIRTEPIPIGDVITAGDGPVRLNGVPIFWGSALLEGSEIETTSSMAFVRLLSDRGVIVIGPGSRVRISCRGAQIRVRVLAGEVTIRSRRDVEVEGPRGSLRLKPASASDGRFRAADLLSSLFVRDGEVFVHRFEEADRVRAGEMSRPIVRSAAESVPPEVVAALALAPFSRAERASVPTPNPMPVPETTERAPLVIACRAEKLFGRGLRVVGKVALGTMPAGGAPVIVRIMFRDRMPGVTVLHVVTGSDGPLLGHYQVLVAATPADLSAGGVVEVVTQWGREIAGNRCSF